MKRWTSCVLSYNDRLMKTEALGLISALFLVALLAYGAKLAPQPAKQPAAAAAATSTPPRVVLAVAPAEEPVKPTLAAAPTPKPTPSQPATQPTKTPATSPQPQPASTPVPSPVSVPSTSPAPQPAASYGLGSNRIVTETYPREQNRDAEWWVSSGGRFTIENGIGKTVQGPLPKTDSLYALYAKGNPLDTEGGLYPQNVFRLVTNKKWKNYEQEMQFRIADHHFTNSPQRNQSNGVLFFSRYQDKDHLYYAGIRVDGKAVIKKKNGAVATGYTTLATGDVYPGSYNASSNPTLLPENKWIGIKVQTTTQSDGSVAIKFFIDTEGNGAWKLAVQATDKNASASFAGEGHGGIRSDFVDLEVRNYAVRSL